MTAAPPLLSINGLRVATRRGRQVTEIVRGVNLDVDAGEKIAVVGESGSGKTLTMLSVLQLLASPPLSVVGGEVLLEGEDLLRVSGERLRAVRGGEIAMVYQDPMSSLNPLLRIGTQIVEALRAHGVGRVMARGRVVELFARVGLPQPERVAASFPHELSGGMLQRVMIAMALSAQPKVLIADEPTTALDVTIQQQILDLVAELQAATAMAVVWVTHDLGVVARLVDRVAVMYAGRVVEQATTRQLFAHPTHPYTQALLASLPGPHVGHREALHQIPGVPPDPARHGSGCPFFERCAYSEPRCAESEPPLTARGEESSAACWKEPSTWRS
ncbi:MAG: ABC transporter ATP-binding protein [Acidimicrobiales bacterium]